MEYGEYKNEKGQLHRIDGPAYIEGNYYKLWCMNGRYHRVDGPAYIGIYRQWWINDKIIINPEDYIHEEIKDYCIYGI